MLLSLDGLITYEEEGNVSIAFNYVLSSLTSITFAS